MSLLSVALAKDRTRLLIKFFFLTELLECYNKPFMARREQFIEELIADNGSRLDVQETFRLGKRLQVLDRLVFPDLPIATEYFSQKGIDDRNNMRMFKPAYFASGEGDSGRYILVAEDLFEEAIEYGQLLSDHFGNRKTDDYKNRQLAYSAIASHEVRHRIQLKLGVTKFKKEDIGELPEPVIRALEKFFPNYDDRIKEEGEDFVNEYDASVIELLVAFEAYNRRLTDQTAKNILLKEPGVLTDN